MKKILIVLVVMVGCFNLYSQSNNGFGIYEPILIDTPRGISKSNVLKDGNYKATIGYINLSTSHTAEYTLSVIIKDDKVIQINFENGGNINYRSPNIYSYSGGKLNFKTDRNGNLTSASTKVTITEMNNSKVVYIISLN